MSHQTYKTFKVVVVDHGSTDGTSGKIAEQFQDVIILKGNESMWWTAATNMGINYALENKASYVLTLNNDTVAHLDYLDNLLAVAEKVPVNSLIGSAALDAVTKQIIFAGDIENWMSETSTFNHKDQFKMQQDYVSCSRFPGRGLLIPAQVFKKIGLFDEKNFPHYNADYDFTSSALEQGFSIFCAIDARLDIFPEESGANKLTRNKSIKNYINHLFGMQGSAQLVLFYKYAWRHCPWYALPSFLILGTVKRLGGYWIK